MNNMFWFDSPETFDSSFSTSKQVIMHPSFEESQWIIIFFICNFYPCKNVCQKTLCNLNASQNKIVFSESKETFVFFKIYVLGCIQSYCVFPIILHESFEISTGSTWVFKNLFFLLRIYKEMPVVLNLQRWNFGFTTSSQI